LGNQVEQFIKAIRGDGVEFGGFEGDVSDDIRQGASDVEELLDLRRACKLLS
jgi:hypothetical protein